MAELKTAFWKKAAKSLPAPYRARYADYFLQAERFDRALDSFLGLFSR
jgi:hypothetical protein